MRRRIAIGFLVLLVVGSLVTIQVLQSNWFRNYVRNKIVASTEESLGGKVEIGSFAFDWRHLHAVITDVVIHGSEPATVAPFFRAARAEVDLQLFTSFTHFLHVTALRVEQPQANIVTLADGTLNVPRPAKPSTSDTSPLETIVDLAVGHFDLSNGSIHFNSSVQRVDVRGENLRLQLAYSTLSRGYQGQLSMQPFYVLRGRNTPVVFTLNVPLTLERDQISLQDATISTALSHLKITGSLAHLRQPETRARVTGGIAIADLNNLAQLSLTNDPAMPILAVDMDARIASDSIKLEKLHLALGGSRLNASGTARDAKGAGTLDIQSDLKLDEVARLAQWKQKLSGQVNLAATSHYDGKLLEFRKLVVKGFGGEVTGEANIENFEAYRANGKLTGMGLQEVERRLGIRPLPYDGVIGGGFELRGNTKDPSGGLEANVKLQIAPGKRGVPVSGRINAEYAALDGTIQASDSYLSLPHSKVNFAGSLQNGIKVEVTSQDLADFFSALPGAPPPVKLKGGKLEATAVVSGTLADPKIKGHASSSRIAIQDRQFDSIATDFRAAQSVLALSNGIVARGMMQGTFAGTVGLAAWSPEPQLPVSLAATVTNGDLADMLALAGQKSDGYSGLLSLSANIAGTLGNPTGSANVTVAKGTLAEEPFDELRAQVALGDRVIRVASAYLTRGPTRLNLTAEFQHPRESFATGHLQAHLTSNAVDLADIRNLQSRRPGVAGSLQLDATIAGDLAEPSEFRLTSVAGDLSAKGVRIDKEDYGDVTAKATTSGNAVSYNLTSNFAGSQISGQGRTLLITDYPTKLDATLSNLAIERVLAAANRRDIPAKGIASGAVHLTGTFKDPLGDADLDIRRATLYEEPIDRLRLRVNYQPGFVDVTQLEANAGPSQITATGRFDHAFGVLDEGTLTFQVKSSRLDLARIKNVQLRRPGLGGALEISGEGKGSIKSAGPDRISVEHLKARIAATGLQAEGHNLGNLELSATGAGDKVNFALDSRLVQAAVRGQGGATLRGDYPLKAELTFDDLSWANLQPLVSPNALPLDAIASGRVTIDGPVLNLDQLSASLRVTKLQVKSTQTQGLRKANLTLRNQGDIAVAMQKGLIRIETARITGQDTDITLSGTASATAKTLDFRVNAKTNLAILKALSNDIYSSGTVDVNASIQGTFEQPLVNGRLELHNTSVTSGDLPVGLSNANGVIAFNDNTATVQTLTGEAGGGRVNLSGFVTNGATLRFALRVNASGVRVRVQQGVSVVATADVRIAGTTDASLVSGLVTIDRLTYLPQTDIGSILTRSGPTVESAASPSPILQNMVLDVVVRTSSSTSIQASLAQNLQVLADLRVRGRASQPGVTGTIQMEHGELAFFGSTYRLSSGTISFYNPNRIEPLLNIALETQAKGVTVVLSVTGPIDNMKLTYTSDPPLRFEEIVALLASGKTPTSDPTLLANQPSQPPQSFQERGESALVGKALADPLSNRLQRVFGVSQLKIDPTFTSGSQLPQARVTLQQQIASNLLFTYVTALDNPNTQIIRIEWSISPQWSAAANRDENGIFSVNLLYKKQFR